MVHFPYKRLYDRVPPNQFCDNCQVPSFTYHLKEAEVTVTYVLPVFMSITEIIKKKLLVHMVWGTLSQH